MENPRLQHMVSSSLIRISWVLCTGARVLVNQDQEVLVTWIKTISEVAWDACSEDRPSIYQSILRYD